MLDDFGRRNGVPQPHTSQSSDLRERTGDHHLAALEDVFDGRFIVRIVDEVVVGFVDQYRDVFRNAVQQQLDVVLGNDRASGIIGITDVYQTGITSVQFGCPDDGFHIGLVIFRQRDGNRSRFAVRGVTVHGFVGRLSADDQFVIGQKGVIHNFQDFA